VQGMTVALSVAFQGNELLTSRCRQRRERGCCSMADALSAPCLTSFDRTREQLALNVVRIDVNLRAFRQGQLMLG
jgi:hypothetical protein